MSNLLLFLIPTLTVGLDLFIHEYDISIDGQTYTRYAINGSGSQWVERYNIGYVSLNSHEDLTVKYHNLLDETTIVHGHGLIPEYKFDGVPFFDAEPLAPKSSATYEYGVQTKREGTYFFHTHYGLQHTGGLAVPIVIKADAPHNYPLKDALQHARDVVMFLEDFCDYFPDAGPSQNPKCNNPWATYKSLKKDWEDEAPTFNYSNCDDPADDTDVAYLYQLANGKTIDDPVVVDVRPGEWIRLRVVNSGTMSSFKLKTGHMNGTIVMTDGQWVVPDKRPKNVFWIGVAQRLDILIRVPSDHSKVFPIIAQEVGNGLQPYHQSGIVFTIDGQAPGHYSRNASDATGFMGVSQELSFRAWYPLSRKPADVEFNIDLTGDSGFNGINKKSWQLPPLIPTYIPNPNPLKVRKGQRVCINLKNYNADAHSMHLHGHSFQVVQIDGEKISGAMRDTLMTARGQCHTMKFCFDADHPGKWPFHCHMSFHLAAGMLTSVEYVD